MREDRVIFLDVDGVLNCDSTKKCVGMWTFVEDGLVARLKQIVEAADAKIVLSSDWRFCDMPEYSGPESEDPRPVLKALHAKLAEFGMEISDTTGRYQALRGEEIGEWLDRHPEVKQFAILDDMSMFCFLQYRRFFVQTNPAVGLTDDNVDEAIRLLTSCYYDR